MSIAEKVQAMKAKGWSKERIERYLAMSAAAARMADTDPHRWGYSTERRHQLDCNPQSVTWGL